MPRNLQYYHLFIASSSIYSRTASSNISDFLASRENAGIVVFERDLHFPFRSSSLTCPTLRYIARVIARSRIIFLQGTAFVKWTEIELDNSTRSNWTRLPRSFFSLHLFYFCRVTWPYNGPAPLKLAFKCRVLVAALFKKTFHSRFVRARFQLTHSRVAKQCSN